jgi:hypothetical protein
MSAPKDEKLAPKGHMQLGGLNSTTQRIGSSMKSIPALSEAIPSTTQRSKEDGIGQW